MYNFGENQHTAWKMCIKMVFTLSKNKTSQVLLMLFG